MMSFTYISVGYHDYNRELCEFVLAKERSITRMNEVMVVDARSRALVRSTARTARRFRGDLDSLKHKSITVGAGSDRGDRCSDAKSKEGSIVVCLSPPGQGVDGQ